VRLEVAAALVDGALVRGDVEVADGRLVRVGLAPGAGAGIAIPGLVDLQVNGFAGVDFGRTDRSGYRRAAQELVATGVTAFLPTLITAPEEGLVAALAELPSDGDGARVLGAHLEGPFLSPIRLGAHPAEHRRDPDPALLERLLGTGPVGLVTLAPELPGAHDLVRTLLARGIAVSAGHSDATAEEAHDAFDLGIRTVTHLFNAMRPFHHRDPGIAGAALAREDVVVQVVLDGEHLAPETAILVWRAARGRLALVSDYTTASGARTEAGVLAGGSATLLEGVRNLHAAGASLEEAIRAASEVPARILGERTLGRLRPGSAADVVVLDDRLELERVLVAGRDAR